jgi:ribonuclease HI
MENTRVIVYTDGCCLGNPGPGGWAFVIDDGKNQKESSGASKMTTNNQMEMTAVIRALSFISSKAEIHGQGFLIHTDSKYVMNGITEWIKGWVRNGWKTADKKPVKNKELWQELLALTASLDLQWKWVKGHAGNPLNERCDVLAKNAAQTATNASA